MMIGRRASDDVRAPAGCDRSGRRGRGQPKYVQSLCAMEEAARRRMTPISPSSSGTRTRRCAQVPEGGLQSIHRPVGRTDRRQLAELKKHGMPVICDQNAVGLAHKDDPTIVGWMQQDEPDNSQEIPGKQRLRAASQPAKSLEIYQGAPERRDRAGRRSCGPRPGCGLGQLVWPRRAHQSPRGLRRVRTRDATSSL